MRRVIAFGCAGETLIGSLDPAPGSCGLLIVSGGNEVRAGAHRGMALLAAEIAAIGHPVFRYDRRGVGDSSGANTGYAGAADDLAAAIATFRSAVPHLTRIAGFGNCDGATSLLLHAPAAFDRLLLANPWVIEESGPLPPPAAIRARYARRLRDPAAWARLARGGIDFTRLFRGLATVASTASQPTSALENAIFAALRAHVDARILLASGDATAIAFADAARRAGYAGRVSTIDSASHSFASSRDKAALKAALLELLA